MPKRVRVRSYTQTSRHGRSHRAIAYTRRAPRQPASVQRKGKNDTGEDVTILLELPLSDLTRLGGASTPMVGGKVAPYEGALSNEEMGIRGGESYDLSRSGTPDLSREDLAILAEVVDKNALPRRVAEMESRARRPSAFRPAHEPTSEMLYREFYGDLPMPRAPRRRVA